MSLLKILQGLVWIFLSLTIGIAVLWGLGFSFALLFTFVFNFSLPTQTLLAWRVCLSIGALLSFALMRFGGDDTPSGRISAPPPPGG